jgi:hypothetical protein
MEDYGRAEMHSADCRTAGSALAHATRWKPKRRKEGLSGFSQPQQALHTRMPGLRRRALG